jgi:hypothetical protein
MYDVADYRRVRCQGDAADSVGVVARTSAINISSHGRLAKFAS